MYLEILFSAMGKGWLPQIIAGNPWWEIEIEAIYNEGNEPDMEKNSIFPSGIVFFKRNIYYILLLRYLGMMYVVILYNELFDWWHKPWILDVWFPCGITG